MTHTPPLKAQAPSGLKFTVKDITMAGMTAALLAVISQISLPMPSGVPITIQVFGVALIGSVLGPKLSFVSVLTYVLLGGAGLPIFSSFHGGLGVLAGVTGGYIWGWLFMAPLCGIHLKKTSSFLSNILFILFGLLGLMLDELAGGLQWAFLSETMSLGAILIYSATAFIPKDIVLTILGLLLGKQVRKTLVRSVILS